MSAAEHDLFTDRRGDGNRERTPKPRECAKAREADRTQRPQDQVDERKERCAGHYARGESTRGE
jgi:hypothetical protein